MAVSRFSDFFSTLWVSLLGSEDICFCFCVSGSGEAVVGERCPPHWDMKDNTAAQCQLGAARAQSTAWCALEVAPHRGSANLAQSSHVPRLRGILYDGPPRSLREFSLFCTGAAYSERQSICDSLC